MTVQLQVQGEPRLDGPSLWPPNPILGVGQVHPRLRRRRCVLYGSGRRFDWVWYNGSFGHACIWQNRGDGWDGGLNGVVTVSTDGGGTSVQYR